MLVGIVLLSVVAGCVSTFIRWGREDQFHGQGWPIPVVAWDKASYYYDHVSPENDYFIDFVCPLALIFNPILYFLFTCAIWGALEVVLLVLRGFRERPETPEPPTTESS